MKTIIETNWTVQELYTYIFIYCMNADYKETSEELDMIISRFGSDMYHKMRLEFKKDNDYQSIQKIQDTLEVFNSSKVEIDKLFNEIKELFLSDGEYVILERILMTGLQKLLK
ncbi:hypothetical protein [Tenacibaculum sp. 190524A02b]|uniref:Uncharacterized protein n=1 Tax=Tenacibaculum vairaonense TaxID=3137860 RepID=A0ABP1F6T2_9FLAO